MNATTLKWIGVAAVAVGALPGNCAGKTAAAGFVVAERGALRADIVIPAKPTNVERFAAEELAYHIGLAVGARPKIVGEGGPGCGEYPFHFSVGRTLAAKAVGLADRDLKREDRVVKQVSDTLYFIGGDNEVPYESIAYDGHTSAFGTIYAVYDLLENEVGVKWLWPGDTGTCVPKNPDLAFAAIDRSGREPLVVRMYHGIPRLDVETFYGFSGVDAYRRYVKAVQRFLLRHRIGRREWVRAGHSFSKYYPKYGKEHPDWFLMYPDGTRGLYTDRPTAWYYMSMCVSNPELHREIISNQIDVVNSRLPIVNVCENDTPGMCACPNCRAWDSKDPRFDKNLYWQNLDPEAKTCFGRFNRLADARWGESSTNAPTQYPASLADRYAKFYNAVLAEARKVNPKARVIGYAYANYVEAPTETKVDPGVVIDFVPRHYFPYSSDEMEFFRKHWLGWRKAGVRDLVYRPNYLHAAQGFPLDSGRGICSDFAFAFTNGMVGCAFDSYQGNNSVHVMQDYALTRCLRDPLRGYEKARQDMLSGFGRAAGEVDRYFDYVEAYGSKWTRKEFLDVCHRNLAPAGIPGGGFNRCAYIVGDFYTDAFFSDVYAILDAADRAAAGDAVVLARIDFLRKGIRASELARRVRIAQKSGDTKAFDAAFRDLCDFRVRTEGDLVGNISLRSDVERRFLSWPHEARSAK